MRRIRVFLARLSGLFGKDRRERDLADEIASNLDLHIQDNLRTGMDPQAARRNALLKFGGIDKTKEEYRDRCGLPLLEVLLRDVRYGVRTMRASPGFTAIGLLVLALGIGANTAIFSVVDAVMIRPLPYPRSDRLVRIWESNTRGNQPYFSASLPNFLSWRRQARSFSDLASWTTGGAIMIVNGESHRALGAFVSGPLFSVLGLRPILGRGIEPEDENPATPSVVVLSRRLWTTDYEADPGIVGKAIPFGGGNVTVVGVVSDDDLMFKNIDLFAGLKNEEMRANRGNHVMTVVGRLRDGVDLERASAELRALAANLEREFPRTNEGWSVRLAPAFQWVIPENVRQGLGMLLVTAGMVLFIACANVSNLLLARGAARSKEMAVRTALGATRARLIGMLVSESAVLALAGGAAGIVLAYWATALFRGALPANLPRVDSIALNTSVMSFSAAVAALSALLFGLAPACRTVKTGIAEALQDGGRGSTGSGQWMRRALVAAQFALATTLVAGSGLLLISLRNLQRVPLGFAPDRLLVARIGFPAARYRTGELRWQAMRRIMDAILSAPGVKGAALSSDAPLQGGDTSQEMYPVGPSALAPGEVFVPEWRIVDPDYFRVMGIPLKAGRFFTERESRDSSTIIVSESYANKLWPGLESTAIGRQLHDQGGGLFTIVGIVGDVRNVSLRRDPVPINYFSAVAAAPLPPTIILRTAGDPLAFTKTLREQVRRIDPVLPIFDVHSMEELVGGNRAQARWHTWLIGSYAGLALVLGALGIYGVLAYTVAQRRREIGIRLAMGATQGRVLRMVLREGMALAAIGIGVGVALALALGQLAASLFYGVRPHDLPTLAAVAGTVALTALAASVVPARRAALSDPVTALRDS